jgi:AcrR family transcriptional regulator
LTLARPEEKRIGKDTLYRRYPDKATLFRDVVRRRIDDMLREIGEGDDERDPLRRLKSLGAAVLDKMLEPEFVKLQRIIIAEAASFPELGTAARDRWGSGCTEICVKVIEQAQTAGGPSKLIRPAACVRKHANERP